MSKNLTAICVRLEPETVQLLEQLKREQVPLMLNRVPHPHHRPYNRSEIVRHAITAGLDVLTSEPILTLKEQRKCLPSQMSLPMTLEEADSG